MEFNKQCAWTATITYNNVAKTVSYPLTCEFNITKSMTSASFCSLNIYNLGKDTRLSEHFRRDPQFEAGKFMMLDFSAGYNGNFITIFRGQIISATSDRRNTDTITTIQAIDAGHSLINSKAMSITFKKGTTFIEAFNTIAGYLNYIQPDARGTLEGEFKTDTTLLGTPLQMLNQLTNNHTFVDNSSLIMLNNNEHLPENPIILSAENGLIDVPKVGEYWITANSIFNPSVKLGQAIQLKTISRDYYNDIYKIFSLNHQGVSSGAISGQRITSITAQKVEYTPNSNNNITQQTEIQGEKVVIGTQVSSPGKNSVQNAYKHIRDHNGDIPKWKINNYISWADMIGHENTNDERYKELTPEILANCVTIANDLHIFLMSSSISGKKPVITSGWRCKRVNTKYHGKETSKHLQGLAIDFHFDTINTLNAYNSVFKPIHGGWPWYTKYYQAENFIHVQRGLGEGRALRDGITKK